MSGGTWVSQNKVRPGAYINFKAVTTPTITIGNRGIVTLAMDLDWGAEGKLIDLYSTDLATGDSLSKVGLMLDEDKAKLLKLALSNAYLCKVYRLNKGGEKATEKVDETLKVTAKYAGTFGNEIVIVKKPVTNGVFEVSTFANGYEVDSQRVGLMEDLEDNDFVTFEVVPGEDTNKESLITVVLKGGTNGTDSEQAYGDYLKLLRTNKWQTLAVTDTTKNSTVIDFIEDLRENEGMYVQAVISNNEDVDYEGIINNVNGVIMDEKEILPREFTAYVAGMTAGAQITESNTGRVIEGATDIIGALDSNEIIEALQNGKFVLSLNQNGSIKVEKDINSLHTYSEDRSYAFSKNRVIRTLDEIGTSIKDTWETTFLGKVSNNDDGRTMFKSSIINYLTDLQNQGAIQAFDSSLVEVTQGNDIDSVIANIVIKPVDSMEFLYMTVNVED